MKTMSEASRDLLQAARSEDLVPSQIRELSVVGDLERDFLAKLEGPGAHLLEGARGMGKSMLLRLAEFELDAEFKNYRQLPVYVNFKTSTLLEGIKTGQVDGFQLWVNTKILQALHEHLVSVDLIAQSGDSDPYYKIFGIPLVQQTKTFLDERIRLLQSLAFAENKEEIFTQIGESFINQVYDTSFLAETVNGIVEQFALERVIFLFDEAAHTFIPSQQEIFFEIFKLLNSGRIAVKGAVYPWVTSYGRNFEPGQDAIVLSMDRFEPGVQGRTRNRQQFRAIIDKRLPTNSSLRKQLFSRGELLDLCIDLSTDNFRAFLHLLNAQLAPTAKFCSECGEPIEAKSSIGGLLEEPVSALSISERLAERVTPHFPKVGSVVQARREEIMEIPYIKEVRSRIIKNAADEFISG
jgi:hypothetical protein